MILAFCAVAYAATLTFDEAPAALAQNVQPATFPRMVIALIAALAALMIALGLPERDKARSLPPAGVFATGAAMCAFVIAFDALGIIAAMVLFALVMPIVWGERRPWRVVIYAALFPTAIWLIFAEALGVHFGPGVLQSLFG